MTIEGSLRTMPAADLLEWISSRNASGRLAVRRDAVLRTFETDGVSITWVSSNRPNDVLSQVLRARGLIDADGLERAASMEVASGVMLGQALVAAGVLSEEQVLAVLDSQIREATLDILSWNRGGFRFVPDRTDRRSRLSVNVTIGELLAIGRGLAGDWAQLRSAAPDLSTRFWNKEKLDHDGSADSPEAKRRHQQLVSAIESGANFGELIAAANSERFVTTADLAVLLGRGLIGVAPIAPGTGPDAARKAVAARSALVAGDHLEALRLARAAADEEPNAADLADLVVEAERALVGHLARTLLGSHRIPRRIASNEEIEQTELSEDERYALDRVDGVWDLFSLVTSSSLGELTSLVTYKQLDERGLIAL